MISAISLIWQAKDLKDSIGFILYRHTLMSPQGLPSIVQKVNELRREILTLNILTSVN